MTSVALQPNNYFDLYGKESSGVSDESTAIKKSLNEIFSHCLTSISIQRSVPATRFAILKREWECDTLHLSSITDMAMHPSYQQIIGMGSSAIPLIMAEIKKQPGHWFWALKAITGEDPVLPGQRGRIKEMTEAWLGWGKTQGYKV